MRMRAWRSSPLRRAVTRRSSCPPSPAAPRARIRRLHAFVRPALAGARAHAADQLPARPLFPHLGADRPLCRDRRPASAAYGDLMHPRAPRPWAAGLAGGLGRRGAVRSSRCPVAAACARRTRSPLPIAGGAVVLAAIGGIVPLRRRRPGRACSSLFVPWQLGFGYFLSRLLRPSPPALAERASVAGIGAGHEGPRLRHPQARRARPAGQGDPPRARRARLRRRQRRRAPAS